MKFLVDVHKLMREWTEVVDDAIAVDMLKRFGVAETNAKGMIDNLACGCTVHVGEHFSVSRLS